MYKDAPHEGFTWRKYARSIALGSLLGPTAAVAAGLDATRAAGAVVLFGLVYAVERALVEFYKTFVREEDQSKYTIPMQFAIFGRVVKSRGHGCCGGRVHRAAAGMVVLWIDRAVAQPHPLLLTVLVGGIGGWISAFGGAWKDAPYEGFQTFKFFRSPFIASMYALGMSQLTDNLVLVTLAATGFTVATTETYKTFFFPSKPRGKFAGMPVHFPDMLVRRQKYIVLYAFIWMVVLGALVLALMDRQPTA
jgi:hypothetical protein